MSCSLYLDRAIPIAITKKNRFNKIEGGKWVELTVEKLCNVFARQSRKCISCSQVDVSLSAQPGSHTKLACRSINPYVLWWKTTFLLCRMYVQWRFVKKNWVTNHIADFLRNWPKNHCRDLETIGHNVLFTLPLSYNQCVWIQIFHVLSKKLCS